MTTPDLKALSDAATQGKWGKHGLDTTHEVSAMQLEGQYRLAEFRHARDAEYAEALVNAHRAGQLFTAADVEAAVRKEREACAEVVESLWAHRTCREVADAIRARTTQETAE